MNFLFINKPFFIEPLGIMYISSAIKKLGHKTDLVTTSENLEKKINSFKPDFIGYSIMTGDQEYYNEINKKLKKKFDFFSIAGGPHPTFFPEFLKDSSFDAICRGEAEGAMQQFLERYSLFAPNFWFKLKSGKIKKNPVQHLISPLDEIPFPDRDIFAQFPEIKNGPIKHFIASRGCPFNCSYCFNESFAKLYQKKGKRVRFRSVDNLIQEIGEVTSNSYTKFVYFQDDTFTLDKNWLGEFSEKYPPQISFPFHCHVRANTIDEEKVRLLKESGCYSVHIAAESGNDELRNKILNRSMSKEQIISASKLLEKHGIKFMLQNIIGIPEGNLETDLETLELNIKCKPDYAWVSIFQPYPGTKLGEFCKIKGYYKGDFRDLGNNFFDSSKLNFSNEYKNQLSNLQKLFAIAVEYPDLYYSGLLNKFIELPYESNKEIFLKLYREFRKKGDKKLYGFDFK